MSGEEGQTLGDEKPNLQGKYSLVRNENFESFLEANGANWMIRKMASNASPTLDITQTGDAFTVKLQSMLHTKDSAFKIGETFEETQQNGVVMNVTPNWEGKKLVMNYVPKDPTAVAKPQKHTRELQGNELVLTLEVENIVAKRIFKREPTSS